MADLDKGFLQHVGGIEKNSFINVLHANTDNDGDDDGDDDDGDDDDDDDEDDEIQLF